ncbi:NAD-binding protein [Intestinibacter sp.]|uniref:NAD-binding protein n=1 Tax=Intestinibacter sp. TaxID=1965304 RepID=UPI002ECFEE76
METKKGTPIVTEMQVIPVAGYDSMLMTLSGAHAPYFTRNIVILATKAGVDPELVYQAIRGGLAGSTVLDAKSNMVMDRNFKPGFRIDLHIKDLGNVLDTAHGVGAPLPLTAAVMEMMQAIKLDGCGTEDHSSLVKYYEKLANAQVVRKGN